MSSGEVINMEKIADDLSIFHTGLWLIFFLGYRQILVILTILATLLCKVMKIGGFVV